MKKILVVHPALVIGGAETVLLNYLRILGKYADRYQIELVLMENRQNNRIEEIPSNIKISYALTGIESEFFLYSANRIGDSVEGEYFYSWYIGCQEKICQFLLEKINSENYDLIIDFQNNYSKFEYFLNKFDVHIPIIKWIHGNSIVDNWIEQKEYFSYILGKYHSIVAIADEMKEKIISLLADIHLENKVSIQRLYNPLDLVNIQQKIFSYEENDKEFLEQEFILHVSRLEPNKNVLELVDIYHQLKQRGIREKFYILGDGLQKTDIQNKINELGLENDCFLLGKRENPIPFMYKAKLFLMASFSEGLPTVLIESMTCCTPVVAYQCLTGPKDILADGKYGALIPLGEQKRFIEKTFELLTEPKAHQHYVDLLPEAVKRFDSETIEQQLIELIDNILLKKCQSN